MVEPHSPVEYRAAEVLTGQEHHRIYRMMKPKVIALLNGDIEVNGIIAPADGFSTTELASCR